MPQTTTIEYATPFDLGLIDSKVSSILEAMKKLDTRLSALEKPATVDKVVKMYAALYGWPVKYVSGQRVLSDQWQAFLNAAKNNPNCPMLVTFNPDNGNFGLGRGLLTQAQIDGVSANPDMAWALDQIDALPNVSIVGYVNLLYGVRDPVIIRQRMVIYKKIYPQVREGYFFDEMPNANLLYVGYCKDLTTYAKTQLGSSAITIGNPGTSVLKEYVGSVSTILIYEGTSLPTETMLRDRTFGLGRENFGVIPWSIGQYNSAWVKMARQYCSLVEMTQDGADENGWDGASIYWDQLAKDLIAP